MVVDDEKLIRMQLRQAIHKEGYQVVEAHNGQQCLTMYEELHPDLILLDAMMPVMDGFTCCQELQQVSKGSRTPVLIITGLEDQESVDRAFEAGATDFITKPVRWAVLRQRIRRLINQAYLYQQLEETNYALERLASLDGLTQIANRRRFDEFIKIEWQRMMREQKPLSVILGDLDFFKAYNDLYGHQAGDHCLRQVALALKDSAQRSSDLVARYGGEEFAVVLPNTDGQNAVKVAEKICRKVEQLKIQHQGSSIASFVTMSLGVATTIPSIKGNWERILRDADQALYQAKDRGKNNVVFRTPAELLPLANVAFVNEP
ncbi:MAG: PleD family two-component system response regulator [Spirulinaceae cyanobacterium]